MKLNDILNDHQTGQDDIQLQSFVLGGRTPWGTYKQALRELYKRVRGIRDSQTELDLLLIDIEELENGQSPVDTFEYRRAAVKLRQKRGQLEEANRGLNDLKRECAIFYREARKLKEVIGEVTPERRTELDREEWKHWLIKTAALGKLTTGRIPEVVLKNAYGMSEEERNELLSSISVNPEHFIERGEYGISAVPPPSEEDIKLLEREISDDHLISG